jgi:hypothetical protein
MEASAWFGKSVAESRRTAKTKDSSIGGHDPDQTCASGPLPGFTGKQQLISRRRNIGKQRQRQRVAAKAARDPAATVGSQIDIYA